MKPNISWKDKRIEAINKLSKKKDGVLQTLILILKKYTLSMNQMQKLY
jgi:hypothetical protein